MLKKRIVITSAIVLGLLALLCVGLLMKNSRLLTASTDLDSVSIRGYAIDTSCDHRIDTDGMHLTKRDVIGALGDDYSEALYDYSQLFYKMTYYDKRRGRRLEIIYLNAPGQPVEWMETVSERKR